MSVSVLNQDKRKKTVIAVLLLVIVVGTALIFLNFYQNQRLLNKERASLTATGTVEAPTVMASFKVQGQIATLLVSEGDRVETGQEIAILDSTEINAKYVQARGAASAADALARQVVDAVSLTRDQVEAAVSQARALVDKAEIGLQDAEQKYNRAKQMHDAGAMSSSQFDEVTNNYNAAQSSLQAAQGSLDQALAARTQVPIAQAKYEAAAGQSDQANGVVQETQAYLDNTRLKSPMAGFITQKYVNQGELVNALTPVYEITDLQHTYIKLYIDEKKIGRVQLGQEAEVTVDAYPGKVFTGRVILVNNAGEFAVRKSINDQYDHDIRSFLIKIDIPNSDLALKTGMTAKVHILEGEK